MATLSHRFPYFVGVPSAEQLAAPIVNLPAGAKVRLRFRQDRIARAFVRVPWGDAEGCTVVAHLLIFVDGCWRLSDARVGINQRRGGR